MYASINAYVDLCVCLSPIYLSISILFSDYCITVKVAKI